MTFWADFILFAVNQKTSQQYSFLAKGKTIEMYSCRPLKNMCDRFPVKRCCTRNVQADGGLIRNRERRERSVKYKLGEAGRQAADYDS